MEKIIFNKENLIKGFNYGIESELYLYNDNGEIVVLKKFKDKYDLRSKVQKARDEIDLKSGRKKESDLKGVIPFTDEIRENKIKKLEIIHDNDLFKDEVQVKKLVYDENGTFIGYTMKYEELKSADMNTRKKYKIMQLKKLKERVIEFNKNGIYYGDFNERNLLCTKDICKLCDLDNIKIGDLDFDLKSISQLDYEKKWTNLEYLDNYCFNIFTISYLYKIHLPYTEFFISQNGLPFRMRTEKNVEIAKKMLSLKQDYNETEFLIDHMRY